MKQLSLLLIAFIPFLFLGGCSGDAGADVAPIASVAEAPAAGVQAPLTVEELESRAIKKDVPYVPTSQETVDEMLRMAGVSGDDLVYDLGSGDGRIVITAATTYGARGVGVDIDPERIREANENARTAGVTDKVRFIQGDLFQTDLRDASAVTLYLLSSVNLRLRPKLLEELRPGTPVVSHDFKMGEWEADEHRRVGADDIYLWIIPAQVGARTWRWTAPDGSTRTVRFDQEFQMLSGNADGLMVREGRLNGNDISFALVRGSARDAPVVERYRGRVNGNRIKGQMEAGGRTSSWLARHD